MSDTSAIKPSFFNSLPTALRDEEARQIAPSDEEVMLQKLSTHTGWKILSRYIDELLDDLDKVTEASMSQGLSDQEIGRNAIVVNIAKGVIRRIQNKVNDAREAIEADGGNQG